MADLCAEAEVTAILSSVAVEDLQCPVSDRCGMLFNNNQWKTRVETQSMTDMDSI